MENNIKVGRGGVMEDPIIMADMQDIYDRDMEWKRLQNKTVLITGAYGMLASYLVFFLIYLNRYHGMNISIIAIGRSESKAKAVFKDCFYDKAFTFRTDNILEPIKDMPPADYIVHAASLAQPRYYSKSPIEVAEPNVLGTYYLLQYAAKISCQAFLYFSSGDVYGKIVSAACITEDMAGCVNPLDVHSCYGESKRMAETWCKAFYLECNVPVRIARIGHTYSPTMDIDNDSRVFAAFMKNVVEQKDIVMFSDGSSKRPFCYIADAVAAYLLLLLKGKDGEAYNVCNTEQFISIRQLAEIVAGLQPELGLQVICKQRRMDDTYVENHDNKENRPVEVKLRELGWECHFDVKEGFGRCFTYLKSIQTRGQDDV